MRLFGLKSILLALLIQGIVLFLFVEYLGVLFFIILEALLILFFYRVICISGNTIKFIFPFPINRSLSLNDIKRVNISDGGLAQSLTTIIFYLNGNEEKKIFMHMYPFERKQLARYFESKGVEVDGNGI